MIYDQFRFSSKKVLVEEGFSPSRVISRQKRFLHLISLTEDPHHPFALNRSLMQMYLAEKVYLPQGTESPLAPMTARYS